MKSFDEFNRQLENLLKKNNLESNHPLLKKENNNLEDNNEKKNPNAAEQVNNFIQAIGATAEMALVFYRNVMAAGASTDEATRLTQAFLAAALFGNNGKN